MNKENAGLYTLAAVGAVQGAYKYYVKPELTAKRTWAVIGAVVATHEILCGPGELLSEGADRLIEKHPVLVPLGILAVAGHVANVIPERYDVISHVHKFFSPD